MNTALFSGSDLDVVFSLVLTMSLSASWIAAAVLVLRLCLKRAPKWVNVLLWGIVAVRLVLPVSIESPLSLLPRTEAILPAVTAQPIQTGTAPAVGSAAAIASGAAMRSQPGWTTILAWVWLVGIAVLLLYTWISTQRLRRKVREAVCGGTSTRPSISPHRSCSACSGRGSICPTTWTAATGSRSSPTNRHICAAGITCGSRWAFCC